VDLASEASTRAFAEAFQRKYSRLDVLINNAGLYTAHRNVTADGLEQTFEVNYLSGFLLTHLLLDLLKKSSPSRIVNVSSRAHEGNTIRFEDLQGERLYSGYRAYGQSKLAQVLFTRELGRRLEGTGVTVTGRAGFIGSHLVERLRARNEVAGLDDVSTGSLRNLETVPREVRVKRASILNRKALATAMEGHEIVYHLAAKTSVPDSVAHPEAYWRTNVQGTLGVLKAAVDAGVRRVVFASTAAVYGDSEDNPKVETMRPA